jgi:hypothetical protein
LFLICLVDNGPFTAAAIAYTERELQHFCQSDPRPKRWCLIDQESVFKIMPPEFKKMISEKGKT